MNKYYLSAPINVTLKITNACNLNCLHCHSRSGTTRNHMEMKIVNKLIDEFKKMKVFGVNISGGEPLLHPHFFDIVKSLDENGIRVTVSTNATIIDKTIAERMKQSNIKGVQISLDSCDREKHDDIRNCPGCFDKTIRGIGFLKEVNIPIMVVTVISKQTIEEYERLIDFVHSLGVEAHKTNALMPIGNAADNYDKLKDKFATDYVRIWKEKKEKFKKTMNLKAEMGFLMQMGPEDYIDSSLPEILNVGCPACLTTCAILEDGNVAICSFCPEIVCGNIKETSFERIWNDSEIINLIRRRDYVGCKNCDYIRHCGGCRARAIFEGSLDSADPFCWRKKV